MPLKIVRNDLTKMNVDVIVNTANPNATFSTGTDYAVYQAAGIDELLAERKKIGVMKEGEVAITLGFLLPAKYIIHAVSPKYIDGHSNEEEKLRSCYRKSLELALQHQCKSIAFPLISTGNLAYPKEEAMRVALDEIHSFLLKEEMLIYLVVFDDVSTKLGRNLYPELESYIDQHYVENKVQEAYDGFRHPFLVRRRNLSSSRGLRAPARDSFFVEEDDIEERESLLEERMQHLSDTFQEYLMYMIELKKLSNAEVYKRALVTKQLFSKIKLNPNYHPDKATAMRLCIGAQLNLDQSKDLLARAGYALSPCDKRDIIFSFFIEQEIYDMIEIDIMLEEYGCPCFIE